MGEKITEYLTVIEDTIRIDAVINELIADGWQPFGNIVPLNSNIVLQTMVMFEEDKK